MFVTSDRPLDATGRPRSPATMAGYHAGRPPRNKGIRYPADPPRVEEIVAVMRAAGQGIQGDRARGLIVVLWRAGLRISEALGLAERDLDPGRGALLVRHGKGGKRREAGMDEWGWEHLRPWMGHRARMPIGALFCVINGPTCGRPWSGLRHERSSGGSRSAPASGAASLPTSCVTPMQSRWPVRESP
jgi:integrase